jgi:hypothetical protein
MVSFHPNIGYKDEITGIKEINTKILAVSLTLDSYPVDWSGSRD